MWVLGVSDVFHDASACLVHDGRPIVAIEEERLARVKHYQGFPARAIRYCLSTAGITFREIDIIARTLSDGRNPRTRNSNGTREVYIRHHMAHAASAFYCSGFDDAAVMTLDGGGTFAVDNIVFDKQVVRERQAFFRGTGSALYGISCFASSENGDDPFPLSVGQMYERITDALGFDAIFDAGKTMALAAYSEATVPLRRVEQAFTRLDDGNWIGVDRTTASVSQYRRRPEEPLLPVHYGMARMIQSELEEAVTSMAEHLYSITRCARLCIAGGVGLNCIANGKILRETPFEEVFVQPAAGDAGLSLGAALSVYYSESGARREEWTMGSASLGRPYRDDEIEKALRGAGNELVVTKVDKQTVVQKTARALADGKVVAWFQGGSEFGPRALGHRSILADSRRSESRERLNDIKGREPFRPVAPAVLEEVADRYFELGCKSPFMTMGALVHMSQRQAIPAVTHADGSARVQTVGKQCGVFRDVLCEFGNMTGVPVLANTSFNVAGEPIVESPVDAVKTFLKASGPNGLDVLACENYLVTRRGSSD